MDFFASNLNSITLFEPKIFPIEEYLFFELSDITTSFLSSFFSSFISSSFSSFLSSSSGCISVTGISPELNAFKSSYSLISSFFSSLFSLICPCFFNLFMEGSTENK